MMKYRIKVTYSRDSFLPFPVLVRFLFDGVSKNLFFFKQAYALPKFLFLSSAGRVLRAYLGNFVTNNKAILVSTTRAHLKVFFEEKRKMD